MRRTAPGPAAPAPRCRRAAPRALPGGGETGTLRGLPAGAVIDLRRGRPPRAAAGARSRPPAPGTRCQGGGKHGPPACLISLSEFISLSCAGRYSHDKARANSGEGLIPRSCCQKKKRKRKKDGKKEKETAFRVLTDHLLSICGYRCSITQACQGIAVLETTERFPSASYRPFFPAGRGESRSLPAAGRQGEGARQGADPELLRQNFQLKQDRVPNRQQFPPPLMSRLC